MKQSADISNFLKPVREKPYQAYLSNALQVADVLDWVLQQLGKSEVWQTSFSISEEFIRRLYFIEKSGLVTRFNLVLDHKHGLTNTIPGLLAAWKRWGFLNGVHYVIGRKPPKSFGKPIIEPAEYEHVITFCNGSCAIIISQDRPGSSNSLMLSWLLIDEARAIQTAGVVRGVSMVKNS